MRQAWPVLLLSAVAAGCGGLSDEPPTASCSVAQNSALEAKMDATLAQATSEVDFSYAVDRKDGRRYTYNRGGSTLQTSYESKSASKLVAAVMIMRLVQDGDLALTDQPQDYVSGWPTGGSNPLSGITLAQLLSFTSGLTVDPPCLEDGNSTIDDCVINIAQANDGNGSIPGQAFFYASAHLQVAALMAVEASGATGWPALFSEFKAQTGLFAASRYDAPSPSNPVLAGGMHFTGADYMAFLKQLKNGQLLSSASMAQLLADRTAGIPLVYSPMFSGIGGGAGLGEDWHYGFGLWHECRSATFNCVPGARISSPGALGTYPFWDRSKNYTGIVVRSGNFGTLTTGIAIERTVRSQAEEWAAC